MDGFDLYTSTNDGTTRYMSWPAFESYATGRLGVGQCVQWGGGAYPEFPNNFGSTSANVSIGMGVMLNGFGNAGIMFEFRSGGSQIAQLEVGTTGTLIAKRNGTTLGTTAAPVLTVSTWAYVEAEFTRHASAGVFKAYVNGVQVLNLTAQNTGASDIDSVRFGANNTSLSMDDLYCTNTATKLGECRIDVLRPTADTGTKDFTASTGTSNFAMVDDTTFDTSDYVQAAAAGNKDLYDVADLSFNPASIYAVNLLSFVKKDDATTRTFRSNLKSSSTTHNGATIGLSTSYVIYSDIIETDPATSTAWTQSGVNAVQIGPEVVS
jgi:hypothetical protein